VRAGISPTGAGSAYSSGQVVTFTVLPNLTYYALSFYVNARAQITANTANGAATAVAAAAAIAAQNAANNASSNTH
jgi:bacteriorhodopsin